MAVLRTDNKRWRSSVGLSLAVAMTVSLMALGCGIEERIKRPEKPIPPDQITLKYERLRGLWLKVPAGAEGADGEIDTSEAVILNFTQESTVSQYDLAATVQDCPYDVPVGLVGKTTSIVAEPTVECTGMRLTPTKLMRNKAGFYQKIYVDDEAGTNWVLVPTDESTVTYLINAKLADEFNLAPSLKDYRIPGPSGDEVFATGKALLADWGEGSWLLSQTLKDVFVASGATTDLESLAFRSGEVVEVGTTGSCVLTWNPQADFSSTGTLAAARFDSISRTDSHWLWSVAESTELKPDCLGDEAVPTGPEGASCIRLLGGNRITLEFAPGFAIRVIQCEGPLLDAALQPKDLQRQVGGLLVPAE